MTDLSKAIGGGLLRVLSGTWVLTFKMHQLCWSSDQDLSEALGELMIAGQRKLQGLNTRIAYRIRDLGVTIPSAIDEFADLSSIETGTTPEGKTARLHEIAGDHRQLALDIETLLVTLEWKDDALSLSLLHELQESHAKCADLVALIADGTSANLH